MVTRLASLMGIADKKRGLNGGVCPKKKISTATKRLKVKLGALDRFHQIWR